MTALSFGCTLSASTAACAKNGRNVSLTPSRASKSCLGALPQPGDVRDVRLDDGGELRGGLQRLDHPLGDDLARAGTSAGWCRAARTATSAGRARRRGRRGAAGRRWRLLGWRPALRRRPAACCGRGLAAAASAARWLRAASSTSCLRMRPPTPVPLIDSSGTECSAASLRTSGVTYGDLASGQRGRLRVRLAGWPGSASTARRRRAAEAAAARRSAGSYGRQRA